ncbi:hypothetical protein ACOSP7_022496 [Xanthoceras sorbifolium]
MHINLRKDCKWKYIWKLKLPPKIRHFLWLVFQGKLLTNLQRCVRGLALEATCPCCHERTEDLNHLFRDCQAAKEVWNKVWRGCWNTNVFSAGFFEWLQSNLRCKSDGPANTPWYLIFTVTLWFLWK